jgi:hypothetical protein
MHFKKRLGTLLSDFFDLKNFINNVSDDAPNADENGIDQHNQVNRGISTRRPQLPGM